MPVWKTCRNKGLSARSLHWLVVEFARGVFSVERNDLYKVAHRYGRSLGGATDFQGAGDRNGADGGFYWTLEYHTLILFPLKEPL